MHKNLKLTLSYNGASFQGYQSQPSGNTVQDILTQAWHILTGEQVVLHGCSRLDAGVHASYFVLHFLSQTQLLEERIIRALNGILHNQLKASICIYNCEFVDEHFHARFHSLGKHYRYLLWYGHKTHALFTPRCWHIHSKNQPENLSGIFQNFLGTHDFSGFRASDCTSKQTVKTIEAVHVNQHPQFPELTIVDIFGDGFLKNMIRNMVGTAVEIYIGKRKESTIVEAFAHKNREIMGVCAPPWALTLMQVYYTKEMFERDTKNYGEKIIL